MKKLVSLEKPLKFYITYGGFVDFSVKLRGCVK